MKKYDKEAPAAASEPEVTATDKPAPAENESEESHAPKKSAKEYIAAFFKSYCGALAVIVALLLIAVIVLLAVMLGGDIYDKAAYFWIIAFLAELGFYKLAKKSRGTLIAMIVTGILAVGFVVLYGLELGGILP